MTRKRVIFLWNVGILYDYKLNIIESILLKNLDTKNVQEFSGNKKIPTPKKFVQINNRNLLLIIDDKPRRSQWQCAFFLWTWHKIVTQLLLVDVINHQKT